jgi:hypothetical protein
MQTQQRQELAQQHTTARQKRLSYSLWARSRGYAKGYQEGVLKATTDITNIIAGLKACYRETVDMATTDTYETAQILAERVVANLSTESALYLRKWITQALAFLRSNRPMILNYHPRYESIITILQSELDTQIRLIPNAELDTVDFHLSDDTGGVEFNWRDILLQSEDLQLDHIGDSHDR